MFKNEEARREQKAVRFIINAVDEFEKIIPRDKVSDIAVTTCAAKDGDYELKGAVGVLSPTGKTKTFGYTALVAFDGEGECSLSDLKIEGIN